MARAKLWTTTPMWRGQAVVIFASGPSMNARVADRVRYATTYRTIVVNNTYKLAPWADLLYAADAEWWKLHHHATETFMGLKATASDVPYDDVLKLRDTGKEGFDDDPACLRTGGNSGYQAIHLAVHLGARRVLLCGFDMHGGHWHERHAPPLREHGDGMFSKWLARFATLAPELAKRGVEVINCTPGSALTLWPFQPLEAALETRALSYS